MASGFAEDEAAEGGLREPTIRLAWERPLSGAGIVDLFPQRQPGITGIIGTRPPQDAESPLMAASAGIGVTDASTVSDKVVVIEVPAQGVRLCLYSIVQDGNVIANTVRYQRGANGLYTAADVMLARWNPPR